jgi:hypothetical protein
MTQVGLIIAGAGLAVATGPASAWSPNGIAFAGTVSPACSRSLEDGRLFAEHVHRLRAGQQVGVNVRSPDFAPVLEIARQGSEQRPLAMVAGAADARASGVVMRAPEEGTYVFRVSTAVRRAEGRYRLEINYSDRIDRAFPGEDTELARGQPGCAPLIMGGD